MHVYAAVLDVKQSLCEHCGIQPCAQVWSTGVTSDLHVVDITSEQQLLSSIGLTNMSVVNVSQSEAVMEAAVETTTTLEASTTTVTATTEAEMVSTSTIAAVSTLAATHTTDSLEATAPLAQPSATTLAAASDDHANGLAMLAAMGFDSSVAAAALASTDGDVAAAVALCEASGPAQVTFPPSSRCRGRAPAVP